MKESKDFQAVAHDWARRKPAILTSYLEAALPRLANVSRDRSAFLVDACVGPRRHEDGSPAAPILIGDLAQKLSKGGNPILLRVRNIEPDAESFAALEAATSQWATTESYRNTHCGFAAALPAILTESKGRPLYALFDPFAPPRLKLTDLLPLWQRDAPTEALIVFHSREVLGTIRQVGDQNTSQTTRQAATETLNNLFGDNSWAAIDTRQADADAVTRFFTDAVAQRFQVKAHAHAVAGRQDGDTLYHLVFLNRQPLGLALMNDALARESDLVTEQGQVVLDFYADRRWGDFVDRLLGFARAHGNRVWLRRELIQHSIAHTFGVASGKDHLRAVQELMARPTGPRLRPLDAKQTLGGEWRTNETTLLRYTDQ